MHGDVGTVGWQAEKKSFQRDAMVRRAGYGTDTALPSESYAATKSLREAVARNERVRVCPLVGWDCWVLALLIRGWRSLADCLPVLSSCLHTWMPLSVVRPRQLPGMDAEASGAGESGAGAGGAGAGAHVRGDGDSSDGSDLEDDAFLEECVGGAVTVQQLPCAQLRFAGGVLEWNNAGTAARGSSK